ncbi:MAG: Vms1/Ankzf1 family peptidyl-tRNA hydrolase [Actinomycetota bacterium]
MAIPSSTSRVLPISKPSPELYEAAPPFATVYLATEGALRDAAGMVERRWKNLRKQLSDMGAQDGILRAIEELLEGSHSKGETLMAVATDQGVVYAAHLPELPQQDQAFVGSLPVLSPFVAATQDLLPHVVVAIDRVGADILAVLPEGDDIHRGVDGKELHVTRSAPGGWSQSRFQQRAENRWKANASQVVDELTLLVDETSPRLVVVSGDVRAVASLREQLPDRVAELFAEVQGDYGNLDEVVVRASQLVTDLAHEDTERLLAELREEHGQQDRSATGPEDTLAALLIGKVETVFLDPAKTEGRTAWYGPDLAQAALFREVLESSGIDNPSEGELAEVFIRAATGTGAAVRITEGTSEIDPTGVGALLRYA